MPLRPIFFGSQRRDRSCVLLSSPHVTDFDSAGRLSPSAAARTDLPKKETEEETSAGPLRRHHGNLLVPPRRRPAVNILP